MRVVVLASQKGGSGKTTLSGHLAVQAELSGAGPVALIDTDPQGSLSQWWNARQAATPAFVAARFDNLAVDLQSLRDQGFKLVFIDTPPAVTHAISQVVGFADMVLLPTRPSPHDLRAVGATVEIAEAHGKAMVFVLNAAPVRARITGEAAVSLSQHGTVAPVTLHHRVDFAASMTDGRTVMEYNSACASAKEVQDLWKYLQDRLAKLEHAPRQFSDPFALAPRPAEQALELPLAPEPAAELPEDNPQYLLMQAVHRLRGGMDAHFDPIAVRDSLADLVPELAAQKAGHDAPPVADDEEQAGSDAHLLPANRLRASPVLRAVQAFGRRWK